MNPKKVVEYKSHANSDKLQFNLLGGTISYLEG